MHEGGPIKELETWSRRFGPAAARNKLRLLHAIAHEDGYPARGLLALHDVLCFLRAYPDDAAVLRAVQEVGERLRSWAVGCKQGNLVDQGFPGSHNIHEYSFGVLRRLVRSFPGSFEVEWKAVEDEITLHNTLVLLVSPAERQGLDAVDLTWRAWFDAVKPDPRRTDLEFLVDLFEQAPLPLEAKGHLFDGCLLPIRSCFDEPGTGIFHLVWPEERIHYQRKDLDRRRVPLAPRIQKPFDRPRPVSPTAGRRLLGLALAALSLRNLEILSLTWADPSDVWLLDCGRGLEVLLIGSLPETRDPFNTTYCHLVLKNGVPLGYGPASVCLGTCEMGLNLFPSYRGAEVNTIYGQLMRCFHQVLGARYFFITSYGMGQGNPAAIRSGAFWFYRKLGFRAVVPEVEALAREEEAKMREDPAYRCDISILRRLSVTGAYFDLSDGACRPVSQGRLGTKLTRFIEERFGGDRRLAEARCSSRVARDLGVSDLRTWSAQERGALRQIAPTLAMLEGMSAWSGQEQRKAVRFIRAKGGRSEAGTDRMLFEHVRLREGLLALANA